MRGDGVSPRSRASAARRNARTSVSSPGSARIVVRLAATICRSIFGRGLASITSGGKRGNGELRDERRACVGTDEFESYGEVHALGDDTCQRDAGAFLALDDNVEQQFVSVRVDLDVTELIGHSRLRRL